MNSRDTTEATSSSLNSDTHKRLVHGSPDFVGAVAVDLLEELVEGCVSLQLLIFLLLADVHHHLVPLAGVVGRCGVLIWRRRRKGDRVKKRWFDLRSGKMLLFKNTPISQNTARVCTFFGRFSSSAV